MTAMTSSLDSTKADATAHLRRYLTGSEDEKTGALSDAAVALVELRSHFITPGGEPDWGGRSYAYRQVVGDVYTGAGVSPEERSSVRAALGYHVGNALRERLSDEELDKIGLRKLSPRDRSVEKRERQAELMSVFRTGPAISTPAEALHALTAARMLLARIPAEALVDGAEDDLAAAREAVAEIGREVTRLRKAAGPRTPE